MNWQIENSFIQNLPIIFLESGYVWSFVFPRNSVFFWEHQGYRSSIAHLFRKTTFSLTRGVFPAMVWIRFKYFRSELIGNTTRARGEWEKIQKNRLWISVKNNTIHNEIVGPSSNLWNVRGRSFPPYLVVIEWWIGWGFNITRAHTKQHEREKRGWWVMRVWCSS